MNYENHCPDSGSLLALLDSQLSGNDQDEVAQHLDTCDKCRDQLDTLVTHGLPDEMNLIQMREMLRSPLAEESSLGDEMLDQLASSIIHQTLLYPEQTDEISLDFLDPSENDEYLGRLGQYEVTEVIGRGGMGIALKGRDTKLDRIVAIKVLAPELASNPTARKRFLREAQAAAAVSHDHVVTTFSVESGKLPYLAMEYIDGQSLQQKLDKHGSLKLKEILRIASQTAQGLAAAHAQGLIHRDIKPSNILLQNGIERVQITDFGLARAIDDVALTRTGELAGTPPYMSPEQAQGLTVDQRSDLFSLGCVMYAMCTGRSPFRASTTIGVLNRVCNDTPRPIGEVSPELPGWLIGIINRLLEKEPGDRFQTAAEVAELLNQCLAHVQQPAVVPLPEALPKTNGVKSHATGRPKWIVGTLLLLVAFGSLGLTEATGVTQLSSAVISTVRGDGTLRIEVSDPDVSVTIEGPDIVISGAGLHEIRLKPGEYTLHADRDGTPVPLERELVTITRRGEEIVRVTLEQSDASPATAISPDIASQADEQAALESIPIVDEVQRLNTLQRMVHAVAISPDGRCALTGGAIHVDSGNADYSLQLWDVQRGTEIRRLSGHLDSVAAVAFSPDGRWALSGSNDKTLRLWDIGTGEQLQQLTGHSGNVSCLAFLPDGKRAISGGVGGVGGGQIILWDLESGKEIRRFKNQAYDVWSVAVSEDGRHVLCGGGGGKIGQLKLWDLETGELIQRIGHLTSYVRTVAFLPDGARVISGDWGGSIRVWDLNSGRELREIVTPLEKGVLSIVVCPDGRRLVVSGFSEKWSTVWLYDLEAAQPVARFSPTGSITNNAVVTTDGEWALAGGAGRFGNIAQVWRVPESDSLESETPPPVISEVRRFEGHRDGIHALTVSPDGRLALSGGGQDWSKESGWYTGTDFGLHLWEIETGEELRQIKGHTSSVYCVKFSPDGTRALSGGDDRTVRLWDVETGKELHCWQSGVVRGISFSPDGRRAVSCNPAQLLDLDAGSQVRQFGPFEGWLWCAAFSLNGRQAVFGGDGRHEEFPIWLCDVEMAEEPRKFLGHEARVECVAFAEEGSKLVSGGHDGTLRVWDTRTGRQLRCIKTPLTWIHSLSLHSDNRHVAVAGSVGVWIFDLKTDNTVCRLDGPEGGSHAVTFTPDGRTVLSGGLDKAIHLWRIPESVGSQADKSQVNAD
jgi:WD40 repeat protein/serine/threonine protein kinase